MLSDLLTYRSSLMFSKPLLPNISAYVVSTTEKVLKSILSTEEIIEEGTQREEKKFRRIFVKKSTRADEVDNEIVHRPWYQNPEVLLCLVLCLVGVVITVWDDMCGRFPLISDANVNDDKFPPASSNDRHSKK